MDYTNRIPNADVPQTELETLLELLQEARQEKELFKTAQANRMAELTADPDYVKFTEGRNRWEQAVASLESELRSKGLQAHLKGQTLPQGLTTKNFTVVKTGDPTQVRQWCLDNFNAVLVVDAKAFESVAKMKLANIPANIATVEQEPRVQIASDLSQYGESNG